MTVANRISGVWAGLFLTAIVLGTACDEGSPQMIDWDLSSSHRTSDVGWDLSAEELSDTDLDATQVEEVSSTRLTLPAGRVFEAETGVRDIILSREGALLNNVQVTFDEETAEDAYDRAKTLVKKWGLDGRNIEAWYAEAKGKTGSEAADVDVSTAFADVAGQDADAGSLGPDGPYVTVRVRYSFDDEKPFLISYELSWDVDT
jgi:hypothetical protein